MAYVLRPQVVRCLRIEELPKIVGRACFDCTLPTVRLNSKTGNRKFAYVGSSWAKASEVILKELGD